MPIPDQDIRQQLRLGENSHWGFKQIEFRGDVPASPRREDLADELIAFANAGGGVLLCGVSDDGRIQGMSREQMAALDRMLVDVSTDTIKPALRIDVHHREIDCKALVQVKVPKGPAERCRSFRPAPGTDEPAPAVGMETFRNQVSMPLNGRVQSIDHCIHRSVAAVNVGEFGRSQAAAATELKRGVSLWRMAASSSSRMARIGAVVAPVDLGVIPPSFRDSRIAG